MVEIGHIVPTFHIIEEFKMLAILDKRPTNNVWIKYNDKW